MSVRFSAELRDRCEKATSTSNMFMQASRECGWDPGQAEPFRCSGVTGGEYRLNLNCYPYDSMLVACADREWGKRAWTEMRKLPP